MVSRTRAELVKSLFLLWVIGTCIPSLGLILVSSIGFVVNAFLAPSGGGVMNAIAGGARKSVAEVPGFVINLALPVVPVVAAVMYLRVPGPEIIFKMLAKVKS